MTSRQLILTVSILGLLALGASGGAGAGATPTALTLTAAIPPPVVLGGRVPIRGRVEPHLAAIRITLEQRQATGWAALGTTRTHADGSYTFLAHPSAAGVATYRVVTAAGAAPAGASPAIPVQVFEWSYLADVYAHPAAGDLDTDPLVSNRVQYEHPVALDAGCYNAWGGSAWVDYSLGRRYQTFTATVGLGDATSDTGSTGSYTVIGDGKTLSTGQLAPGAATKVSVSLVGVAKLRLMSNIPDPTGAAGCSASYTQVVFGDAQILGPPPSSTG